MDGTGDLARVDRRWVDFGVMLTVAEDSSARGADTPTAYRRRMLFLCESGGPTWGRHSALNCGLPKPTTYKKESGLSTHTQDSFSLARGGRCGLSSFLSTDGQLDARYNVDLQSRRINKPCDRKFSDRNR